MGCRSRSEGDVKALPAIVPGRESYSDSVVGVSKRGSGGGVSSLVEANVSRSGSVGCRFKTSSPSLASCLALIAFSFLKAFSTFVRTIFSILWLILRRQ